jgi:hypothetical protein
LDEFIAGSFQWDSAFLDVYFKKKLDTQHNRQEFDFNGPGGAILATGPTVPAFIRVTHFQGFVHQIKHIQGAMLITDPAGITLVVIDDRRHSYLLGLVVKKLSQENCFNTSFEAYSDIQQLTIFD